METFRTRIESANSKKFYNFECYDNTEPISIGDYFIFFFAGIADVGRCTSEHEKKEINPNDFEYQKDKIDLVYNFWKKCYKIKSTDFDLTLV
mgnify:CR=1 FL=1